MDAPKAGANAPTEGKPKKDLAPPRKAYSETEGGKAISALLSESEDTSGRGPKGSKGSEPNTPPKKSPKPVVAETDDEDGDESDEFDLEDTSEDETPNDDGEETPDDDESEDDDDADDEEDDESAGDDEDDADDTDDDTEEHADLTKAFRHPKTGEKLTLEELFKGHLRTADYTRKTQALATERKKVEKELKPQIAAYRDNAKKLAEQLALVEKAIDEATPKEPNWDDVKRDDPEGFAELYAQWGLHKERRAKIAADAKKAADEANKVHQDEVMELIAEENAKLIDTMPGWKDDQERAQKGFKAIWEYGKSLGFKEENMHGITDHRLFVILDKARKWDIAQKKGKGAVKPVSTPRSARPSSANDSTATPSRREKPVVELQQAKARLKKTGKLRDGAKAISLLLKHERA